MPSSRSNTVSPPPVPAASRLWLWGSVILMYFGCVTLPLVGKAGSRTEHSGKNFLTVLLILLLSICCNVISAWIRGKRSGGRPVQRWGWWGYFVMQLLILVVLVSGGFAV